jgi:hypothetical protein
MKTGEDVEFSIEDGFVANIAHLTWIDGDVFVFVLP